MTTNKPTIAPDWCVLGIDQTHHWHLDPRLMAHLDGILTIYAFNRNAHTYCCEITPSYWCEAVQFVPLYKPGTPEAVIDETENEIGAVNRSESDSYYHVSAIERGIAEHPEHFHSYGAGEDETEHGATVPGWVLESWYSNPKF